MCVPGMGKLVHTPTDLRWLPLLVASTLLSFPLPGLAQDAGSIAGQVSSASTNQPLAAAQVFLVGTEIGTLTAATGRFLLVNVPVGSYEVRAQLVGYGEESQRVTVRAGETVAADFALSEQAVQLEEVVVTGTGGAARRREIGNSVGTIGAQELALTPAASFSQALYGQTTGLQQFSNEGQVGAGNTIILRGISSVTQGTQPLIYVDGVRVNIEGNPGPDGAQTSPSALDHLNPDNIARVEVIRGAAATTLYGTEAAGGVIQIFTKRGETGQEASWQLKVTGGGRFQTGNGLGPIVGEHESHMFLRPYLRMGAVRSIDGSVRGGTSALRYFASGAYDYQEGVVRTTAPSGSRSGATSASSRRRGSGST